MIDFKSYAIKRVKYNDNVILNLLRGSRQINSRFLRRKQTETQEPPVSFTPFYKLFYFYKPNLSDLPK